MKLYWYTLILVLSFSARAQVFNTSEPLAHTYSIVAIDPETGDMGVAVQSHWFSVGTLVSWGEAGVGVIATQSFVNPAFGPNGLELLKMGYSAQETLDFLIENDEGRAVRQVAILDASGNVATHTGSNCIQFAGDIQGDGYSVQANMMLNERVWPEMDQAFRSSNELPLAERLLVALEAAEAAGGDIRGKQSAAILIVSANPTGMTWVDRKMDLRIADHEDPIGELRRLITIHKAYAHMNQGDQEMEHGNIDGALQQYGAAETLYDANVEMPYWTAISLLNAGRIEEGLAKIKSVIETDQNWKALTLRIVENGLLTVDEQVLEQIRQL